MTGDHDLLDDVVGDVIDYDDDDDYNDDDYDDNENNSQAVRHCFRGGRPSLWSAFTQR